MAQNDYYRSSMTAVQIENTLLGRGNCLPFPVASRNGNLGQVLTSKGDGTTEWTDASRPTQAQVASAVSDYFEEHPGAQADIDDTLSVAGMAADAKATGDAIASVKSVLPAIKREIVQDYHPILTKISGESVRSSDGTINVNASYARSDYIDIFGATAFRIAGDQIINFCIYDINKKFLSGRNMQSATDTGLVTVPASAKYVIFSIFDVRSIDSYTVTLQNYSTPSYQNEAAIKTVVSNAIVGNQFPNNLCDQVSFFDNVYVDTSSGLLAPNQPNYFATWFIPVSGGVSYRANHGRNCAWYDSSYNYISGVSGASIQSGITSPSNAAYIRFTINKTTDGLSNPAGLYFTETSLFDQTVTIPGLAVQATPWCAGKTVNWIGDSIVAGDDFDEVVCAALGIQTENDYGINGSTIALNGDGTDGRNALCNRYASMTNDTDIIAVSAGSNDFEYAWSPIGTIDSTDNTTFYGALKNLCEGLITKYPHKVIFFTTPIKRMQPFVNGAGGTYTADYVNTTPSSRNKYGLTLGDYADIIKEVCGLYSIPVLDMYRESLLNPHLVAQQDCFAKEQNTSYSTSFYFYTHPNLTGQKIMARRVAGWLTQLGYVIDGL